MSWQRWDDMEQWFFVRALLVWGWLGTVVLSPFLIVFGLVYLGRQMFAIWQERMKETPK